MWFTTVMKKKKKIKVWELKMIQKYTCFMENMNFTNK